MNLDLTSARRRDNLPRNPDVRFGRTVDTSKGRGSVAWIDWKNDTVHVQLFGAPVEERVVKHGAYDQKSFIFKTWEETVFPYDEVTPVPAAVRTEEDLDQFLATHSSGKHRPKRAAARKTSTHRPISYESTDTLTIGEVVTVDAQPNPQLFVAKAYTPKLIVVQDTVTGAVGFAQVNESRRTGKNFLQPSLV